MNAREAKLRQRARYAGLLLVRLEGGLHELRAIRADTRPITEGLPIVGDLEAIELALDRLTGPRED